MKAETSKLLENALSLPPEARTALAGSLIESLDESVDADAEAAWAEEIARRVQKRKSQDGSLAESPAYDSWTLNGGQPTFRG